MEIRKESIQGNTNGTAAITKTSKVTDCLQRIATDSFQTPESSSEIKAVFSFVSKPMKRFAPILQLEMYLVPIQVRIGLRNYQNFYPGRPWEPKAHSFFSASLQQFPNISFYYFETSVSENELKFYYTLKPGISEDRIGYLILEKEGVVKLLQSLT